MKPVNPDWWWRSYQPWLLKVFTIDLSEVDNLEREVDLEMRRFKSSEEWPAWLFELARRTDKKMKSKPKLFPIWPRLSAQRRRAICRNFHQKTDHIIQSPLESSEFDYQHPQEATLFLSKGKGFTPPEVITVNLNASNKAITRAFLIWLDEQRFIQKHPSSKANVGVRRRPISWRYLEAIDEPAVDPSMGNKAKNKLAGKHLTPDVLSVFYRTSKSILPVW